MITRWQALELLHAHLQSVNLRRHCYAVEAIMKALAKRLAGNEKRWEIVGLLHDGDYELTKNDPANHAKLMAQWVKDAGETDEELIQGILSHGLFHEGKEPRNTMEWALYTCDDLSGFIVACALVRPDPSASSGQAKTKLESLTVESILKKWPQKSFAAGVKRQQVELCQEKLSISLEDFIKICLGAMQRIAPELGL